MIDMREDPEKLKRMKGTRFYTHKSYQWMERTRLVLLIVLSPIWLPFYLLQWAMQIGAYWLERLLSKGDNLLQKFLDKVIPQKK
jgi:hypothetical protein